MFDAPAKPALPPEEIIRRIEKALRLGNDTHTCEDVRRLILEGNAHIIYDDHGVWIVEVMESPQKRWLNAWIVAGQLPEVMSLQAEVERYAHAHDCAFIRAECRPGWKIVYPQYGWSQRGIVIVKELTHGSV